VPSCTEVSMGVSTGALVVMVGAVGAGEAGDTVGASRPWACAEIVKLARCGPAVMGCLSALGPIRKLGGERGKLLILLVFICIFV
jgi:hypothetical protein